MKKFFALIIACVITLSLVGCDSEDIRTDTESALSYDEAVSELTSLLTKLTVNKVEEPRLDIYQDTSEANVLADIDTFPIMVSESGEINIEIAGATEFTADKSPDDWLNIVAKNFNKEKFEIDGQTVSVTVRQITSGEVVTYMVANAYSPQVYIPSAYPWADMLESAGIGIEKITDRIAGNTAGILMKNDVYDTFIEKYNELTLSNLLTAAINGEVLFAYPNPYTSTTGLNGVGGILSAFDPDDPLSAKASEKLLEYQKTSPPVAYTTAVLSSQAAKGIINTMLMEEQAYINKPELNGFTYVPFGVRHDHPVYTFDYCTDDQKEAARLFVNYCLNEKNQQLATEKGFNRHDDYVSQDPGLSGTGWTNAQAIWKENKNGGRPIIAVFIADTSDSMAGEPINALKQSLVNASSYISPEHYVGLVSYSSRVTINLPIEQFSPTQRAYFSGEVKNLTASGLTATYDAVLVGLDMLAKKAKELPEAKLMLFLLSDGDSNSGYSLKRITPIVKGMTVPVYTIAYNYNDLSKSLETLSQINESASLNANSDDIITHLRNLFNTQM